MKGLECHLSARFPDALGTNRTYRRAWLNTRPHVLQSAHAQKLLHLDWCDALELVQNCNDQEQPDSRLKAVDTIGNYPK